MPQKAKKNKKAKKTPQDLEESTAATGEDRSDKKDNNAKKQLLEALFGSKVSVNDKNATVEELGNLHKNTEHKFWDKMPMPSFKEAAPEKVESGPLENKTLDDVRKQPLKLPKGFEWYEVDLNDEKDATDVYELLTNHYVEDDENHFRFNYAKSFLQWALLAPGYLREWHLSVRGQAKKNLLAFITAIPADVSIYGKTVSMVEINFLCVHKKLRSKRLAPVLIKEITRRVNVRDRWQAVYTAGIVIPKPIARNRYWHRSLNPKKLVEIGFSSIPKRYTMSRLIVSNRVPEKPQTPGFRCMMKKDLPETHALLMGYLKNFDIFIEFSLEEFKHWMYPKEGVVSSFVVEDPETKKITDMCSYYSLPSSVLGDDKYKDLRAAYSFYNVSTKTKWVELITNALTMAKQDGFDVFNALDVMDNQKFLRELKFGIGSGHLQYYLFNWRCPLMPPHKVGIVLL